VVLTAHDLKIACPNYRMLSGNEICERCKGGRFHNVVIQRCVHDSRLASTIVAIEAVTHRLLGSYRDNVDRIVVPSRFFVDKFVEWGWEAERFVHIPNFVEAERFDPQFEPGQAFLYFGRLSSEKGLATLIHAAAASGVKLRVVGTGPDEQSLRGLAASLGGEVEFLGYRTGNDLHDLVRASRAVVLPSEWYENAPLSVLESFAMGKPVIGARIGGIPEMVEPGVTGWLFRSGDVQELADLLRRVAAEPDPAVAGLGKSAREVAVTKFSKSAYLDATRGLYASLART
jgi:glycosyltransferase involved in cell wall biosynthesis